MSYRLTSLVCLLLLLPSTTSVIALPASDDAALRVETFDRAWQLINDRYWDPDFGGLDWAALKEEFRPDAIAAEDNEQLRGVLREMIDRLGQSHFCLLYTSPSPRDQRGSRMPSSA